MRRKRIGRKALNHRSSVGEQLKNSGARGMLVIFGLWWSPAGTHYAVLGGWGERFGQAMRVRCVIIEHTTHDDYCKQRNVYFRVTNFRRRLRSAHPSKGCLPIVRRRVVVRLKRNVYRTMLCVILLYSLDPVNPSARPRPVMLITLRQWSQVDGSASPAVSAIRRFPPCPAPPWNVASSRGTVPSTGGMTGFSKKRTDERSSPTDWWRRRRPAAQTIRPLARRRRRLTIKIL